MKQVVLDKKSDGRKAGLSIDSYTLVINRVESPAAFNIPYERLDAYCFFLTRRPASLIYGNRRLKSNGNSLIITNPWTAFSLEIPAAASGIFRCIVPPDFFGQDHAIDGYSLFKRNGTALLSLSDDQLAAAEILFQRLADEFLTDFSYKNELMRNILLDLIFQALKISPDKDYIDTGFNSLARITMDFKRLLDRQFPIESASQRILYRYPADYSRLLFISTNHLNRALKTITGKTTSGWIAERMIEESQSMLCNSDLKLPQIAHCLGFARPQHFISFFKKHTGGTPAAFKKLSRSVASHVASPNLNDGPFLPLQ